MPIQFTTPQTTPELIQLAGGWYTLSSPLVAPPGSIRDSQNWEVVADPIGVGYSLTAGYERFDGQPSPSAATFIIVQIEFFINTPTVGQTLTGNTSLATGKIIAIGANFMALTKVSGTFTTSEVVKVGATTIGTATPLTTILSPLATAQYTALAADVYRADILEVPGSGPVQGVFEANLTGDEIVYAFRANVGGTATELYKSSGSGWANVPFYYEVGFNTGGSAVPAEGTTLTKGSVTATVARVVTESGQWADGDAAGRIIFQVASGGSFSAGAATIGAINLTLTGAEQKITFTPGGLFEFDIADFGPGRRVYGCDGVNRGFEFDGTVLVPITTGFSPDAPKHVKEHKKHLFFAFSTSAAHSGIGAPYRWTADDGALEIGCGDTVSNFLSQGGNAETAVLGITTLSNTHFLYGTSAANWNLISYNNGVGGVHYTSRLLEQAYWFSHSGLVNVRSTSAFGDFTQSSVTSRIPDFIESQRAKNMFAVVNHTKHQYRVYFNDGQALYTTIVNGKSLGSARMVFPHTFSCGWGSKTSSIEERVWCGAATSGYVYKMDTGSSFDGAILDSYLILNQNFSKAHRVKKKYSAISFDIKGNFYAEFQFGYTLSYNSTLVNQPASAVYSSNFASAPLWDSFTWDSFTWDGSTITPTEGDIRGNGFNIQPSIRTSANYVLPFTISTLTLHVTPLRTIKKMGR